MEAQYMKLAEGKFGDLVLDYECVDGHLQGQKGKATRYTFQACVAMFVRDVNGDMWVMEVTWWISNKGFKPSNTFQVGNFNRCVGPSNTIEYDTNNTVTESVFLQQLECLVRAVALLVKEIASAASAASATSFSTTNAASTTSSPATSVTSAINAPSSQAPAPRTTTTSATTPSATNELSVPVVVIYAYMKGMEVNATKAIVQRNPEHRDLLKWTRFECFYRQNHVKLYPDS